MAAASGISLHPGVAARLHEYAGAGGRRGDRTRRGALGLAPVPVISLLDPVTRSATGHGIGSHAGSWLFLAPIEPLRASYSPLLFFVVATLLVVVTWLSVRVFYHGRV